MVNMLLGGAVVEPAHPDRLPGRRHEPARTAAGAAEEPASVDSRILRLHQGHHLAQQEAYRIVLWCKLVAAFRI